MVNNSEKLKQAILKELRSVEKTETRLQRASAEESSKYKELIKSKIPPKILTTLEKAFFKAFELIFEKGISVIERGYSKESLSQDFLIHDYAINVKCNRRELKRLNKSAKKTNFINLSITAAEGIGLGALGIGLPDIVLFLGMVLKGIYETALHYGYEYTADSERFLILKLIETSLTRGETRERSDTEIDALLRMPTGVDADTLKKQIEETSRLLAMDMLVLKFVQGFPIIGMIGGAFNPVYYNKMLNYTRLKYYKRYLLDKLYALEEA